MMIMLLLMALLLCSAAITIFFTPEQPARRRRANRVQRTSLDPDSALGWQAGYRSLIAERGLFLLGIYGLQAFGQYYLGDVLQVADPARRAGDLLASVGAGTVLLACGGSMADGQSGSQEDPLSRLRHHCRRTAAR